MTYEIESIPIRNDSDRPIDVFVEPEGYSVDLMPGQICKLILDQAQSEQDLHILFEDSRISVFVRPTDILVDNRSVYD